MRRTVFSHSAEYLAARAAAARHSLVGARQSLGCQAGRGAVQDFPAQCSQQ